MATLPLIPPHDPREHSDWLLVVDNETPALYWWPLHSIGFRYEEDLVLIDTEKLYAWQTREGINIAIHKDLLR